MSTATIFFVQTSEKTSPYLGSLKQNYCYADVVGTEWNGHFSTQLQRNLENYPKIIIIYLSFRTLMKLIYIYNC